MEKLKVTGSIVTYNNASIILKCIDSVLKETKDVDFELYVCDNASADSTVALIKKYYPQVHLIEGDENLGFGAGHNQVLSWIDSKYHVMINPDILLDEDTISGMAGYMEQNLDVGIVTPKILFADGKEQHLPKKDPTIRYVILSKLKPFRFYRRQYTRADEIFTAPTAVDSSTGCFFMIRTEVLKKLKGFDEHFFMYFEDADLSRRVRRNWKIIFHPGYHAFHEWKRDNTRSLGGVWIFMQSMVKYMYKWSVFNKNPRWQPYE